MIVAFRVDASREIASGHVMRCLTLAGGLREAGVESVFVCRAHPGHLGARIAAAGHRVELLAPPVTVAAPHPAPVDDLPAAEGAAAGPFARYGSWVGASWEDDAEETVAVLAPLAPAWVVVDHYGLDARWEARVARALGARVLAIDGQADRVHDCDVLLDQTYSPAGAARWDGLVPARCRRFAGPAYSLLRPEFERARAAVRARDGVVRRLLVAFGGVDRPGATGLALDVAAGVLPPGLPVDVIAGSGFADLDGLERRCRALPGATLHVEPPDVAALMAAADLCVGGGGTMLWERCALGLPSIVVAIAPNQIELSRVLAEAGACVFAGALGDEALAGALARVLQSALADPGLVRDVGAAAARLLEPPAGETPLDVVLTGLAG